MPSHNNAIQRPHLRKHYKKFVKTWFNQPARKLRRIQKRKAKAAAVFPRPINKLRPQVSKPTFRYSGQKRLGRGFSLEEIKKVGLNADFARTIGISVDHRRTNKSVESLQRNVQILKAYLDKLILLPKNPKAPKKGRNGVLSDATDTSNLVQNTHQTVVPLKTQALREKPSKVLPEMNQFRAHKQLRLERTNQKWAGKRAEKLKKD